MSTFITTAYHILVEENFNWCIFDVIHTNISDLPGLLLLVVLAFYSAVSLQLTVTL